MSGVCEVQGSQARDMVILMHEATPRDIKKRQGDGWQGLTSSMNTMEGAFSLASEKSWLTSFSDSPSHLETRSEEDTLKKVDSASVATALAR